MNDEGSVFENAETSAHLSCDSLEAQDASAGTACNDTTQEEASTGTDEAAIDVLADTGTDLDSGSQGTDPATQESELEQLRGELKQLREELAARDARLQRDSRIEKEYAEFCELYPDVSVSSLPEEIWKRVDAGTSLAAAYALAERKRAISLKKATESNESNRTRSAGAVNNAQSTEFSPAEVRAMTSQEVRANLSKIMRSMQKWH